MKKKIFTILLIFTFIVSLSFVSASENDTVLSASNDDLMSVSNNNISLQSNANDNILGQSSQPDNLLGDEEIPTQISLERSADGLIEDNKITITATLTDADGNLLKGKTVQPFVDGTTTGTRTTDENGQIFFDLSRNSGFYYFQVKFLGQEGYAQSNSEIIEVAFANNNALTDFVVRMILSDGVMNLTKDYKGYGSNKVLRKNASTGQVINNYENLNMGIPITSNLVVNGNGHKIDLTSDYSQRSLFVFNKENVRVTLNNLSIENAYTNDPSYPIMSIKKHVYLNLNYVNISNCRSLDNQVIIDAPPMSSGNLYVNVKNSIFTNNVGDGIFSETIISSDIEQNIFLNNSNVFKINWWDTVNIRYNIFIENPSIFHYVFRPSWEVGEVKGNYFGTNDTNYINNNLLPNNDVPLSYFDYENKGHTYLTISGNPTFCEDDVQDYKIYFTGNVPAYKTVLTYTSAYSTINATDITITSNPTTVRVSPKTYGLETLVIEPDLYELNINITKSTKINYNVTVVAPGSEYLSPLVITVNVKDVDDNPVTTKANVTVDGTTHTINITDGVGSLEINGLAIGSYEITTKIISNMANYRNTTIYSTATITKIRPMITLSCSNQSSIARENITFNINVKNRQGINIPNINVTLFEDNEEIAKLTTDAEGNIIFIYAPEAGNHTYYAGIAASDYSYGKLSSPVEVNVKSKIPTKLTISSDTEMITESGQKATFNVKLVDVNNTPLSGAEIKLVVNDVVVDSANTGANGECEFEYTNTSGLYLIKAVYNGNLTHYDNSSEIIELIVSTGENFFDLSILINVTKNNGVLNIFRDFTFNETLDQDFVNGIPINKNITIKGNDKVINALNKAKVFNIKADAVTIDNLNVINASSGSSGGAIYFDGTALTILNSKFEDNEVILTTEETITQVGGGAIYSKGVLNIYNSTFYNNKVFADDNAPIEFNGGGAIFALNGLNVYNSLFDSNKALNVNVIEDGEAYSSYGSSAYIGGGNALIQNSTFKNGLADVNTVFFSNMNNGNFSVYDSLFLNNSANRNGALGISAASGRIVNTTFENNSAKIIGAVLLQVSEFLISESRFIGNSAESEGVFSTYYGNNITVEKSYFLNNHADDTGAVFYSESVGLTLRYNIFVNNTGNVSGVYYEYSEDYDDNGNFNYDYWGNNTPYDANVFNDKIPKTFDYITLEIIGENVTYTTIPTTYTIKFNGTNADKLPNFETLIDALANSGVNLDKTSIVINGSGATVVLTSDAVQNVTLIVGPEYNVLALFNIVVEQLIKKNYTSDITVSPTVYGSTIVATVEILDEEGNGINGSLTYTFNDKTENATIENGKAQIPLGRLDAGEYKISFVYNSTDLFYNDLTGNKSFDVSKANATFTLDVNNATYGEDVTVTATPQRGLEGNFTFYIKDILNQTVPIELGEAKWTLKDFPAGNYTIIATYNGNNNYNPATLSKNFTISKAEPKIEITVNDVNYGDDIIAVVTGVNVKGNVTVTVNNKNYTVEILNNTGNVTIDKLNVGNYTAFVVFDGNANITGLTNETEFKVYKASANMTVDIGESIVGHDTTITVKFRDDVEGSVTITVDGTPKEIPIENGVATLNLTDLAGGQHTVNVTYSGNSNFNSSAFNTTFSTKSLTSQINVTASDIVYGNKLVVKATVTSDATGEVEFTVNNVTKTGTIKNGVATATFEGLNAGDYNITAKYLGDSTYISSTNTTTAAVLKANSTVLIDIGEIKWGENVAITFTVLGNATGIVTVEIPGLYSPRNRTLENGVNKWVISPVYGNYTVKVTYNGDNNYLTSSNSTDLVSKYKPSIDIVINDAFVGDDYTIDVILNDTATGTVLITVDGKKYNKTLSNGKASLALKNLTAGTHSVEVIYSGDVRFYNATKSKSFVPKSFVSGINVTAKDIVYGNDLIVKATVTSGATGEVEFTVDKVTKKATLKNGVAQVSFSDLDVKSYEITAKYLGDREYSSSTNKTTATVRKASSYVLIDVGEIKEGENVVIKFTVPSKATGNLAVEIPGLYSSRNRTITNGAASWTLAPLKSGTYTLNVAYNGDKNYLASSNSAVLISKAHPNIDIEVSESVVGQDVTVNVALPSNATGSVMISVDGVKYNKTLSKGKASVTVSNIAKGTHKVDAVYSGDKYYYPASNSTSFEPKMSNSTINVMASNIEFGEDLIVRAIVNEDATGTVTFTVNGVDKSVQIHQGFASATFTGLDAGTYDVKAAYSGNDVYSSSANTTKATVSKVKSTLLISVGEIKDGENVVIRFIVPSKASGVVTVEIPGLYSSRNRTIVNGAASWTITPLSAGLYEVIASYGGDKNYYGSSNSTYIDYNRVKTTLNVDAIVTKNNVRLKANLTAENGQLITAWVNVTVNGTKYRIPVYNGTGYLDLGSLPGGDYQYSALYPGTRAIINSTDEGSFKVIPVVPILNVPDVVKYYKGSERLYVYLIDNYNDPIANKTVVISINKNNYTRTTDSNGTASIALNLGSGEYSVTVTAAEYSLQKVAKVTILPTVNGTDVVKVYRNGTQYYATFRDSQGNYLADGTTVKFNINGVFYERKISGDKGLARLNLNLPQGEYILTATNPVTGENAANNIKVISKIIENKDITKYYKNGTQYTVKILGDDGKPVGAGVEVTFNINGVLYKRTTDASGIAKLTINLIPGDYIITAEYGGCKVSNNIKVLSVLSAKDMSKKYGTSDQFVATLVDGQGKPYPDQTIQFNINGVFYNRVTNEYGQARLNINLMAGQYIITSSYNGLNIANKVTIIP